MPLFPPPPPLDLPEPPPLVFAVQDEAPGGSSTAADAPEASPPSEERSPAFFGVGTVEAKLRVGFAARSLSPLSLLGAFLGWTELQAAVDVGVFRVSSLSVGLGAEAHYARPWLIELLSEAVVGATTDARINWSMVDMGLAGRVTLHYTDFDQFDPYGVFLMGPSYSRFYASIEQNDVVGEGSWSSAGMRVGGGGGVNFVSEGGFVAGVELRYLLGLRFREKVDIDLTDETGTTIDVFEAEGLVNPPRGFSWMLFAGYRF